MYSRILILRFPKTEVSKPTVCHLAKNFDLSFNILRATILPRKEGIMVLELFGTKKNFKLGIAYLKEQGVLVQNASQEVNRNQEKCIHCGACTAFCPTASLYFDRDSWKVLFEPERCNGCELCVSACPVGEDALAFRDGKTEAPSYRYRYCIRCYCCQEMCPHKAISVRKPFLGRLLTG